MGIELLLIQHGPAIAMLAALTAAALGAVLGVAPSARRALRATRAFRARARGAQRGLSRAKSGDRVVVHGMLEARGEARTIDLRPCAASSTVCGGAQLDERAPWLSVRADGRSIDVVGAVSVDAAHDARTLGASALGIDALARLADADVPPDLGPIESRTLTTGTRVLVLGRVEVITSDEVGYRSALRGPGVVPDDDGVVHAIGIGSPLSFAASRAGVGALVGTLIATLVLNLGAPLSLAVARDQRGGASLPYALWLPLLFPPTRDEALAHAARRSAGEQAPNDAVLAGFAAHLRAEHGPRLRRALDEVRVADVPTLATSTPPEPSGPRDDAAGRNARARALGLPDVAPSAEVDRISSLYELPTPPRSAYASRMLAARLRDVALLEAALGHEQPAMDALRAARENVSSVDDVVVGVALVLACRPDLRQSTWSPDTHPHAIALAILSREHGRTPSYERDILLALGDPDVPRPRHPVAEVVALLRAAGAALVLQQPGEASWLADRAMLVAHALPATDERARSALLAQIAARP